MSVCGRYLLPGLLAPLIACGGADGSGTAVAPPVGVVAEPFHHSTLSAVLTARMRGQAAPELLSSYLASLARVQPTTNGELFPDRDATLAALVNAHVAWTLALTADPALSDRPVPALRERSFAFAGSDWTLARLEHEILARERTEPRVGLFLNPGLHGGPPLPEFALEGYALRWQLAMHAARCGAIAGFWTLDRDRREVRVSAWTAKLPGLPRQEPIRTRYLLDAVPPPADLRAAINETCGHALSACTVSLIPVPDDRW